MTESLDALVVGLGIHGSAACFELAARGLRVAGIEQFEERHERGSSHGRTRMIRRAYPHPVWNDLVDRAYTGWRRWEAAGGETLVRRTGGLYAHAGTSRLQGPDLERVDDPARQRELMPSLVVPAGHGAVYDPAAGVVEAAAALRVARTGARAAGAELSFGESMIGWTAEDGDAGVRVTTSKRTIRASSLVLAVGAWTGVVLPQLADQFEVWRILTLTVRADQAVAQPPALGCFSVDRPEGLAFGIPDAAGNGCKLGVDAARLWNPAQAPPAPSREEVAELRALLEAYVPGLDTEPAEATACLYTMTEDRRFVLGRLPESPQVLVATACSGHGFKFAPAVGEAVADLATGVDRPDLDFIGVDRRLGRGSADDAASHHPNIIPQGGLT